MTPATLEQNSVAIATHDAPADLDVVDTAADDADSDELAGKRVTALECYSSHV